MNQREEMLSKKLSDLNQQKTPHILVIGDVMLDHYIFGNANRLSPEAPVPVVNVRNESKIIGGAGNVANNITALGGKVSIASVVGADDFGKEIKNILKEKNIHSDALFFDKSRSSTIKTRVLASNHQIVRIDRENLHDIDSALEEQIFEAVKPLISDVDIIILSDYNKGLLTYQLCQSVINYANSLHKKVVIDPKGIDYSKYKGAFLIKPNRKELSETSRIENINNQEKLKAAADVIFKNTQTVNLVVTLSEEGMAILTPQSCEVLPVQATEVYDVTGAGDTVIATMAYCLALGFNLHEACQIANYAAAIVIKHVGSATTSIEEIISEIED
ncbi:D-glycero-beta-D-manno-heptose-7-phosphate kinase [Pedobacter glucosidilyticus]|uniref:D-glycero-beta-D-manno-heptose-7-phosphate kinase n=1 Tax=Pedobacter glucosidilyticus TaxID=1122941 RepID=UPI0026EDA81B|nr:D-glycero-beta-D-manno-heptose-7-phosphate kinase [Pedobacter glucosidilyticus]